MTSSPRPKAAPPADTPTTPSSTAPTDATRTAGSDAPGAATHTDVLQGNSVFNTPPEQGTVNSTAANIVKMQNDAAGVGGVRSNPESKVNQPAGSATVTPVGETRSGNTAAERKAAAEAKNAAVIDKPAATTSATTDSTTPKTAPASDASTTAAERKAAAEARNATVIDKPAGTTPTTPTDVKPGPGTSADSVAAERRAAAESRNATVIDKPGGTTPTTPADIKPGPGTSADSVAAERRAAAETRSATVIDKPGGTTPNTLTDVKPGPGTSADSVAADRRAAAEVRNAAVIDKPGGTTPGVTPTDTRPAPGSGAETPSVADRRAASEARNAAVIDKPAPGSVTDRGPTGGTDPTVRGETPTAADLRQQSLVRNAAVVGDNPPGTRGVTPGDNPTGTRGLTAGDTPGPKPADGPPTDAAALRQQRLEASMAKNNVDPSTRTKVPADSPTSGKGPDSPAVTPGDAAPTSLRQQRLEASMAKNGIEPAPKPVETNPRVAETNPRRIPVETPAAPLTSSQLHDQRLQASLNKNAAVIPGADNGTKGRTVTPGADTTVPTTANPTGGEHLTGRERRALEAAGVTPVLTEREQRRADRAAAVEARKQAIANGTNATEIPKRTEVTATTNGTATSVVDTKIPRPDRRAADVATATDTTPRPAKAREVTPPVATTDATSNVPATPVRGKFQGPDVAPEAVPGKRGEVPVAPKGEVPVVPKGDATAAVDPRKAFADARARVEVPANPNARADNPTMPLNPNQQKWLNEQIAKMPEGRGNNFQRNFESLSEQNRAALMNLDGKQQFDMINRMTRNRADLGQLETKLAAGDIKPGGDLKLGRPGDLPGGGKGTIDGAMNPGKVNLDGLAAGKGNLDALIKGGQAGDLARALQRADVKIPGLDTANPVNAKFLADASLRFNNLQLDGNTANMRVADILKGLDPQRVSALEKYLSGNNATLEPGKLTLGQLDGAKFTQLQSILRGNFDAATGRPLTPQESFAQLTQNLRFNRGDVIGRGQLPELGRILDSQPGARLGDMVSRTLDARTPGSTTGSAAGMFDLNINPRLEFTSRLNPVQELHIRNLLDNSSKLSQLLDSNIMRVEQVAGRMDVRTIGMAQVLATTFGDSARGDFAVRGDVRAIVDRAPMTATPVAQDGGDYVSTVAGARSQEYISRLPIDATTGLPYDPSTGKLLDPMTGRAVGDRAPEEKKTNKRDDEADDWDEKDKKKRKQDSETDQEKAKQKAMLLLLQAKKKREQELKDKAARDAKRKEEDEKRVKYICKDGDTVQSIALKQLRDSRVAALIYQINKDVIPTRIINGEQVPVLHAGLIIWLPSPKESREFRTKLVSNATAAASPQTGEKEFASAEEELAAKFGSNWSGDPSSQTSEAPEQNSIEKKLMEDAMADAKRRRQNIEAALGPIASNKDANRAPTGQLLYQVRLGDTLRSVAQKQPSLGDVHLWRLLAEVNGLSTDVDSKGQPIASLTRGTKIKLPTAQEIADYRQRIGSMAGQPMAGQPTPRDPRTTKTCRTCGRLNSAAATLCPGCGYEFGPVKTSTISDTTPVPPRRDAATVLLDTLTGNNSTPTRAGGSAEAARTNAAETNTAKTHGARTQDLDAARPEPVPTVVQSTVDLDSRPLMDSNQTASDSSQEETWASIKDFEPTCRLAKSAHSWDSAQGKLVIQLQLKEPDKDWYPILEYDIFETHAIRHTFVREGGAKKSVRIDLPAAAAMELAQNDLIANWSNYKDKYFR